MEKDLEEALRRHFALNLVLEAHVTSVHQKMGGALTAGDLPIHNSKRRS
jgi:hypothetical protein